MIQKKAKLASAPPSVNLQLSCKDNLTSNPKGDHMKLVPYASVVGSRCVQ